MQRVSYVVSEIGIFKGLVLIAHLREMEQVGNCATIRNFGERVGFPDLSALNHKLLEVIEPN